MTVARELTKRSAEAAIAADSKENAAIWWENAALHKAASGNTAQALQDAAEGLKLAPESQGVGVEAALAYAMVSDNRRARFVADGLDKRFPLDTPVQSLAACYSCATGAESNQSGGGSSRSAGG
jgi:hypothetical protein